MSDTDRISLQDDRVHQPGLLAAFRTRRREVRTADAATVREAPAARSEPRLARDAYERGRRDERARRRGSPLLSFVVLLIAVAGGAMAYLAAREGSFAAGGQVVDHAISSAAQPARSAADNAGTALENAGQSLKNRAGSSQP